jgi:hypothetical protein
MTWFPFTENMEEGYEDLSWGAERPMGEKAQKFELFGGMIVSGIVL